VCVCVCVCVCVYLIMRDLETSKRGYLGPICAIAPHKTLTIYVLNQTIYPANAVKDNETHLSQQHTKP
jgi:hypothetical protein